MPGPPRHTNEEPRNEPLLHAPSCNINQAGAGWGRVETMWFGHRCLFSGLGQVGEVL